MRRVKATSRVQSMFIAEINESVYRRKPTFVGTRHEFTAVFHIIFPPLSTLAEKQLLGLVIHQGRFDHFFLVPIRVLKKTLKSPMVRRRQHTLTLQDRLR